MFNLIRGDLYRILHKKSIWIYFPIVGLAYILIAFFVSKSNPNTELDSMADILFIFLPAVIGGWIFITLYTDDLESKNLSSLVGYGLKKQIIVFEKLLIAALLNLIIFAIVPLYMSVVAGVLREFPIGEILESITYLSFAYCLKSIGLTALAAVFVYGIQKPTVAIPVFFVLTFDIPAQLLTLFFGLIHIEEVIHASNYLMGSITLRMHAGITTGAELLNPVISYIAYVGIATALTVFAFRKKELEF